LNGLGSDLKKRIEIVFIDEHGLEESGIDGGGLFKELLTSYVSFQMHESVLHQLRYRGFDTDYRKKFLIQIEVYG